MDEVTVDSFVNPTEGSDPAFENVFLPGVVLGVWVQVEVLMITQLDEFGIESKAVQSRGRGGGFGEGLALFEQILVDPGPEQEAQVGGVDQFGLFDVDRPNQELG